MRARRIGIALLIGLLAGGVAAVLQLLQAGAGYDPTGIGGPLRALEDAAQDLALQARRPESYLQLPGGGQVPVSQDPRDAIVIVAIDERTIDELGAYNGGYPRRYQADLVERLLSAPPRVIGIDIGFFEPTSDDAQLLSAFEHARQSATRIVLAGAGLLQRGTQAGHAPTGELRYPGGLLPVPALAEHSQVGLSNVLPDERGTIRAMPLLSQIGEVEYPSFGLASASAYLRRPAPIDGRPAPDTIELAGRRIPVDSASAVRINYFGPPSEPYSAEATFRVISFVDVLRERVDPSQWRGRLVLVGASGAAGLADDYWTPASRGTKMPGVEIHANVAATLLSTQFLRSAPTLVQLALVLGLSMVIALLAGQLPIWLASSSALVLLVGEVVASLWALFAFGLQLPLANPVLGGALAFTGVVVWRVAIEQRQARALQRALASVIPPGVAQEIARAPERVHLGGERRTLTLLFTDLKGFTSFSETIEAELVSRIVTEYLAEMTSVVFDHGGTVDKFIGDSVMAFWNAPLDDAEHARHACESALEMQRALQALNARWTEQGMMTQRMRIGINTGPVSVGNMGTRKRFAYTAVGDSVNLAARLEPLNDEYGTHICVSQATVDAAGSGFLVRFLDLVAVKGKSVPVAVYELLGRADDPALQACWAPVLEPYHQGVRQYRARRFEQARSLFQAALAMRDDAPSALYVRRCAALEMDPPPDDWNGVYVMQHK
ncbi:MAG TPA: adenylate/guanylate cyclase domain-containing protein [Chloroflexota bacterium]